MNNERRRGGGLSEAERRELEDFYRELVSSYVNFPANLKLELKESYRGWALMIEPDVSDYAIVAGKRGRNFNALKELVDAIGGKRRLDEFEILLEGPPVIDDPKLGQKRFTDQRIRKQLPYKINPQWTPELIKPIVTKTLRMAGLAHVQWQMQKNTVIDDTNPFGDQWYYSFTGPRGRREMVICVAVGQLMESVGTVQGQRLIPKLREAALEKAS